MELSKANIQKIIAHLQKVRMLLLKEQPFYGALLMHVQFYLDSTCPTAYTDGEMIAFSPQFIQNMSDTELKFVLLHELLHIVFKHCSIRNFTDFDAELYNIACDIVINSNILFSYNQNLSVISIHNQVAMHLAPNDKEGYLYTADEVYRMFSKTPYKKKLGKDGSGEPSLGQSIFNSSGRFDDHSKWKKSDSRQADAWDERIIDAYTLAENMKQCGNIPQYIVSMVQKLKKPTLDWRVLLQNFLQEEIHDYSFCPPDYRYQETDFFLPAFNEKEAELHQIWFMVDTSGSITNKDLIDVFSELQGALNQFQNRLTGMLYFFDANVKEPGIAIENIINILEIKPIGRGGTSFKAIFEFLKTVAELPNAIIILTDGLADIPDESVTQGVPVLWVLNNEKITPKWGKIARIQPNKD